MRRLVVLPPFIVAGVGALSVGLAACGPRVPASSSAMRDGAETVEHSASTAPVIITWTERSPAIASEDMTPRLRIAVDGRVYVHRPVYARNSGDYTFRLSSADLRKLVEFIIDRGFFAFDAEGVRERMAELRRSAIEGRPQRVVEQKPEDLGTTIIAVDLRSYPLDGLQAPSVLEKTVEWYGLEHDAKAFPSIEALRNLEAIQTRLRSLSADARLEPVGQN